jgi:hypothetical protein
VLILRDPDSYGKGDKPTRLMVDIATEATLRRRQAFLKRELLKTALRQEHTRFHGPPGRLVWELRNRERHQGNHKGTDSVLRGVRHLSVRVVCNRRGHLRTGLLDLLWRLEGSHLQSLDLSECVFSGSNASELAYLLRRFTALTSLSLAGCQLSNGRNEVAPRDIELMWSIQELTALQRLDLSRNALGGWGMTECSMTLCKLTALTELSLRRNGVACPLLGGDLLGTLAGLSALQRLDLAQNTLRFDIMDAYYAHRDAATGRMPQLWSLALEGCGLYHPDFNDEVGNATRGVARLLRKVPNATHVSLAYMGMQDDDAITS